MLEEWKALNHLVGYHSGFLLVSMCSLMLKDKEQEGKESVT